MVVVYMKDMQGKEMYILELIVRLFFDWLM